MSRLESRTFTQRACVRTAAKRSVSLRASRRTMSGPVSQIRCVQVLARTYAMPNLMPDHFGTASGTSGFVDENPATAPAPSPSAKQKRVAALAKAREDRLLAEANDVIRKAEREKGLGPWG